MDVRKKRRIIIAGLALIALGGLLYIYSMWRRAGRDEGKAKAVITTTITIERTIKKSNDIENFHAESLPPPVVRNVRYKSQPLHFAYEVKGFKPTIHSSVGTKRFHSALDELQVICSSKNCGRQLVADKTAVAKKKPEKPLKQIRVVRHDVVLSRDSLEYLSGDVLVMGNLYIDNMQFLRIPRNFSIVGNIYVSNSEGLTFMGGNIIDGSIFIRGKSSVRALPRDVKLSGQIFL